MNMVESSVVRITNTDKNIKLQTITIDKLKAVNKVNSV